MNLFKTEEIIVITVAWMWNVKYVAQILLCVVPENIHTPPPPPPPQRKGWEILEGWGRVKGRGNSRGGLGIIYVDKL